MHESSLARQLLNKALQLTPPGARLRRLRCRLAETEHLHPDAITFHFDAYAKDTPAAGAELHVITTHVEARCTKCETVYPPDHHLTLCPTCGCTEAELLQQTGVSIESIDVE